MKFNPERLFPVIVDPDLLQQFEPYIRITVDLADVPQPKFPDQPPVIDTLEMILNSWGVLGFYAAMHDEESARATGLGRHEELARWSRLRLSLLLQRQERRLEHLVQYDAMSEAWLDVLLNCLESYHVRVAPIAKVELSSNPEPSQLPEAEAGGQQGEATASAQARRRHWWWPF